MAHTLVITGEAVCAGGNHVTIGYVLDGGAKVQRQYEIDQARVALTADDIDQLRTLLLRAAIAGLTASQAKTKLQAGVTVSIL